MIRRMVIPIEPRARPAIPRTVYDYYAVDLGGLIADEEDRANIAMMEARERARLYVMPCEWQILSDDGDMVRVRRKRRRT